MPAKKKEPDQLSLKAQEALKDMFGDLESVSADDIKLDGFTVRQGNKLIRLEVVHDEPITVENEVREEYRLKLRDKLQEIKSRLNKKINDVVDMTSKIRQEAEKKERELKEKLRKVKAMPDISWRDATKGVSVVQGDHRDEIIYLVRGIYYPKFVNEKPIDPTYAKKLMTPVVFLIRTVGNRITELSTRKPMGLEIFPHYHQQNPDCWGDFSYAKSFRNTADIIKIAREAEAVLENVNTHSIAMSSPRGLPRKPTLMRHIVTNTTRKKKLDKGIKMKTEDVRVGMADQLRNNEDDIWTT
jgi:hypothetical protein